jgi:hypothetical protein
MFGICRRIKEKKCGNGWAKMNEIIRFAFSQQLK